MDDKEKAELLKTLKDLEKKVSALSSPYEDWHASEVTESDRWGTSLV